MIRLFAVLLLVVGASQAWASDVSFLQRMMELRDMESGSRKAASNPPPARLPGQAERLVRVIYLVPSDVAPTSLEYNDRVADMTGRIRLAMETVDDFYAYEQERLGVASPGRRLNLERETNGQIRVMAMRGRRTRGLKGRLLAGERHSRPRGTRHRREALGRSDGGGRSI